MSEPLMVIAVMGGVALFAIGILMFTSRAARKRDTLLSKIAGDMGWTDVRVSSFLGAKVRGVSNGVNVSIAYKPRHKSTPERLKTVMESPEPGRLIARRRFGGFFSNRPLFGPPIIEHPQFWIRTDERLMAQRLLDGRDRLALVQRNLVTRFDELRLDARGIRIERSIERSTWGFDEAAVRAVAQAEWELVLGMSRT